MKSQKNVYNIQFSSTQPGLIIFKMIAEKLK